MSPKPLAATRGAPFRWLLIVMTMTSINLLGHSAKAVSIMTVIDDFTAVGVPSPWIGGNPGNHDGLDGLDLTLDIMAVTPIPAGAASGTYSEAGLAGVFGGSRRSDLAVVQSNAVDDVALALVNVLPAANGIFSFESYLAQATATLTYEGTLPGMAGSFFVQFLDFDSENQTPLPVRLTIDAGAGGFGQYDTVLPMEIDPVGNGDPPFDLELPLSAFGGLDLSGPLKLSFSFLGGLTDDFTVEQITLVTQVENVPEPSALALAGSAMVAFAVWAAWRRRQRRVDRTNRGGQHSNASLTHEPFSSTAC